MPSSSGINQLVDCQHPPTSAPLQFLSGFRQSHLCAAADLLVRLILFFISSSDPFLFLFAFSTGNLFFKTIDFLVPFVAFCLFPLFSRRSPPFFSFIQMVIGSQVDVTTSARSGAPKKISSARRPCAPKLQSS